MIEMLTQISDISTKNRAYNVPDFESYELIMFKILAQISDIATKIRNILNKRFKIWTKILEI